MAGSRAQRPVPSVLLIGLILLVASHLVGALHGPGFLGPHKPLTAVGVVQSVAAVETETVESGHGHGHGHDHHHEFHEDTVEHAVDRVRSSADGPVHSPQIDEPTTSRLAASASLGHARPEDGDPEPSGGRSACTRHCVWRQ